MRTALLLPLLVACPQSEPTPPGGVDQLRSIGVNVDGFNVLHAAPPSREAGTDLGPVPLVTDEHLIGAQARVQIVGQVEDWRAELVGDPVFSLIVDDFFGILVGITCYPPGVGSYQTQLVLTAPSQPGRAFHVPFACQGDDRARLLAVDAADIGPDGTVLGTSGSTGALAWLPPGGEPIALPLTGVAGPTSLLDDGSAAFVADGSFHVAAPLATTTDVVTPAAPPVGTPRYSQDGAVALYVAGGVLHRLDLATGADTEVGPSATYAALLWSDPSGRWALIRSGNQASVDHPAFLVDTVTGDHEPLLDSEGQALMTGFGTDLIALDDSRERVLALYSYFYDVDLYWLDLATGEQTHLLDLARADMQARHGNANHAISAYDLTPDGRHIAVVFDNFRSDPGGFALRGSGVYVIDLTDGRTWLANMHPSGEPIRFAFGGFDGRLVEHVRIRPDAEQIVFGDRYLTDRALWRELE